MGGEAGPPKPLGWAREGAIGSMALEGRPVCEPSKLTNGLCVQHTLGSMKDPGDAAGKDTGTVKECDSRADFHKILSVCMFMVSHLVIFLLGYVETLISSNVEFLDLHTCSWLQLQLN